MIWDGGFGERPEDEREGEASWEDPNDGDMPWDPNPVSKPQPWEAQTWGETPMEQMWRDLLDGEGG